MKIYKISSNACPVCQDPSCNHICFYKPTLDVYIRLSKEYKEIQSLIENNKIKELNKLLSTSWISRFLPNKDVSKYIEYYKSEIDNHLSALKRLEAEHPDLKIIRDETIV